MTPPRCFNDLAADLVPHGRGTDVAVRGMLAAVNAIAGMAAAPGKASRDNFERALKAAQGSCDPSYLHAFEAVAWLAIDELRLGTEGTYL
jgi:hypothetical protein